MLFELGAEFSWMISDSRNGRYLADKSDGGNSDRNVGVMHTSSVQPRRRAVLVLASLKEVPFGTVTYSSSVLWF